MQTRRNFLVNSAILTSAAALARPLQAGRRSKIDDLKESQNFGLGVASGDATANSVVLWTKNKQPSLQLCLWQMQNEQAFEILSEQIFPDENGFALTKISGLSEKSKFCYAFAELDSLGQPISRSRFGYFQTAPASDDIVPITLGACSCTYNHFEIPLLEHAAARDDLNAFLLLGDTSYNDGCETPEEFNDSWAASLSRPGYLELRAKTSVIATLDDHELADNFDPETVSSSHLAAAKTAFFSHLPVGRTEEEPFRVWRKIRMGGTCEIFVLDTRTERLPSTRRQSNEQYLSPKQMAWLKTSLKESDALFKVIMNSVPIMDYSLPQTADRWAGYPNQRKEILSFIDDNEIPGVLWVSGDFHFASFGRVSKRGPGQKALEVLVGPGAQVPNPLGLGLNLSSQFEWASIRNNYVTLHFDPYKLEVTLNYHGSSENPRSQSWIIEQIFSKTVSF